MEIEQHRQKLTAQQTEGVVEANRREASHEKDKALVSTLNDGRNA